MSPATTHALFPGTFDPPTLAHLDLVQRGLSLFERVTVAVAVHHSKDPLLPVEERLALIERSVVHLERVSVTTLEGLVVEGCRRLGAGAILRGVRGVVDLEAERRMALTNRSLAPEIETVLLLPAAHHAHLSSALVRQIARMGGDLSNLVPPPVVQALGERFGGGRP